MLELIAALLCDVQNTHGVVFNNRSRRLTLRKISRRVHSEGIGFLTKSLPRLGKALDRALAEETPLNGPSLGFKAQRGSKLPIFMGELFNRVLDQGGQPLPNPCTTSVRTLRAILFVFYKYELPYTDECERNVVQKFTETEDEITSHHNRALQSRRELVEYTTRYSRHRCKNPTSYGEVARSANSLLKELLCNFDPKDIYPKHGPGAVSTREQLWDKYLWTNVSAKITDLYPFDAYFCASVGHFCDTLDQLSGLKEESLPAKVCLVPKDSRGPRLISCEPVDHQWVQQGIGQALTAHIEAHPLTRENVRFTDQVPNRMAALVGSVAGKYSTLDLSEASDRVTLGLVRLLFPEGLLPYLECCRSLSTVLPDGRIQTLNKFAPMGSCLCFPILALTIWAILTVTEPDADARSSIYVFGDDVIVKTASAENAIKWLEEFGLKINRSKSCTKGFFRESCGMDAFKGSDVTPVKLKTVWSSVPSPDVYVAWVAYANSYFDRQYYCIYNQIVDWLHHTYGDIPDDSMHIGCVPSLRAVPEDKKPRLKRWHRHYQKWRYLVPTILTPSVTNIRNDYVPLFRYFAEHANTKNQANMEEQPITRTSFEDDNDWFSVSTYTRRSTSMLVHRWR